MKRYYIQTPIADFDEGAVTEYLHHIHSYGANGAAFSPIRNTVYGYIEFTDDRCPDGELPEEIVKRLNLVPGIQPVYYSIDEGAARQAKQAMSWSDYKAGSKTAEYRLMVDKAAVLAEYCKRRVDPMYHEQIDGILNRYACKLAENLNAESRISASCPSVMIAGASNFPVRKKQKQVARLDKNFEEYEQINGLLDKMRSIGHGGISSDDPNAVAKLKAKLERLEKSQATMKTANAYFRKHKTMDGCPDLSEETIESIKAEMQKPYHHCDAPFEPWALSNNSAEIRRVKQRIAELEARQNAPTPEGWEFDGGKVVINTGINRLQILFNEKPDEETRTALKVNGFRWSPKESAWQRQYTDNAVWAAKRLSFLAPVGEAS